MTVARIVFTIPEEIAEAMETRTAPVYLDVFGSVRMMSTGEKVGDWMRIGGGRVSRYQKNVTRPEGEPTA